MTRSRYSADVVVVGGGVIGSSVALHLRQRNRQLRVVVVERDARYTRSSSRLAFGGIRQQYGSRLNVAMAQFSLAFYKQLDSGTARTRRPTSAHFTQCGYLFLASARNAEDIERRYTQALASGAAVEWWTRERIRVNVPGLNVTDIEFASFGQADGYLSPQEALAGLKVLAQQSGAVYIDGEVTGIGTAAGRIAGAQITTRDRDIRLETTQVVNAAGAYAAGVAGLAGITLPIQAQRQILCRVELANRLPSRCPVIFDPDGTYWRRDDGVAAINASDGLVIGRLAMDEPMGENFDVDDDAWHLSIKPSLAHRYPVATVRSLKEAWAGLFEMTPDRNGIIGEHPEIRGFVIAAGFSGHGLMLAPATGLAVAELICDGVCTSFDVTPLAADRFARGDLFFDGALPTAS